MNPEFDPRKDAANVAKHGVSLATGDGVLHDPLAITIEDSAALDELLGLRLARIRSAH